MSSRENTNEVLPTPPEETHEDGLHPLKVLSTLVVGNALFHDIRGDSAVKKHVGELVAQQILGCDQDGGLLSCASHGAWCNLRVHSEVTRTLCTRSWGASYTVLLSRTSPFWGPLRRSRRRTREV